MRLTLDTGDIIARLLIIALASMLVYSIFYIIIDARVLKACLLHGWRDSMITWDFQGFCAREENEYEIVKPLSEIVAQEY